EIAATGQRADRDGRIGVLSRRRLTRRGRKCLPLGGFRHYRQERTVEGPHMTSEANWAPLPPSSTGLRGRCPRCGQGHLFKGFLSLRPNCEVCGLDYSFADSGDGPAFFVMCFGCVPSVALAVWI